MTPMLDLWTNFTDDPQSVIDAWPTWSVQRSYIAGNLVDNGDPLNWDLTKVDARLANIPVDHDGPLCLDWEGDGLRALNDGSSDPNHATVLARFISLAAYVQSQRPDAKVGFYALVSREYWQQNQAWYDAMGELAPLFEQCDALFPSVYDFYPSSLGLPDLERFGEIVRLSLELAGGKPVWPYMHHRHHNSTADGFRLIDDDEIIEHIAHLATNISHDGQSIAGIVAWGADSYYYNTAFDEPQPQGDNWDRIRANFLLEMNVGETIEEYVARLHPLVYANYRAALGSDEVGVPEAAPSLSFQTMLDNDLCNVFYNVEQFAVLIQYTPAGEPVREIKAILEPVDDEIRLDTIESDLFVRIKASDVAGEGVLRPVSGDKAVIRNRLCTLSSFETLPGDGEHLLRFHVGRPVNTSAADTEGDIVGP